MKKDPWSLGRKLVTGLSRFWEGGYPGSDPKDREALVERPLEDRAGDIG